MADQPERRCPDCRGRARQIKLVIRAGGHEASLIEYARPDSKRNFWSSKFPAEGSASAFLYDESGRVLFYRARMGKS